MTAPWRVVETRYDDQGRLATTVDHLTIGTAPMTEHDAKTVATQQMGRYAASFPKRTFRAEPVPATAPVVADVTQQTVEAPAFTPWLADPGDYFAEDFAPASHNIAGGL